MQHTAAARSAQSSKGRNTPPKPSQQAKARHKQVLVDDNIRIRTRERLKGDYQRTVSNVGVYTRPGPYDGPKVFQVYAPLVQQQLAAGVPLKGRPPVPFIVTRDEALIRPFGGFRVRWRDIEVGRMLSWPTYEDCRRLRELRRHDATPDERKVLNAD